ncbi:cAMP-regulated phosphoprotein 21-like isoform X2 [Iris pallida]|uniref:cAMP-regulated phosphoprotein 21-like isoform X2 n=1 Tax=Iris pallida TaxID=29817 RepID=A0AAX6GDP8_IRIPA|nr:cAMP-regulated phosphoprotein 21-like isoform X2 [Iris pallida]
MEPPSLSCAPAHDSGAAAREGDEEGRGRAVGVDAFLVEALDNPRHRLTVLRMELDIQKFMQNCDQQQFEFQHLPTSYLKCAAHRVAQHYGLQTMALDNIIDCFSSRVVARKTPESRFPAICLSDVPIKQAEKEKNEHVKFVIRPRPSKALLDDGIESGTRKSPVRTVEERKEEYDKARARIFSGPPSPEIEIPSSIFTADARSECLNQYEQECYRNIPLTEEQEKIVNNDGASTMAIFRDREKDQSDPDYDRSYDSLKLCRYFRGFVPSHDFRMRACSVQPSFLQYEPGFHQLGQFPRTHHSPASYMPPDLAVAPFSSVGCNQTSPDAVYMQWPSPAMVYAQSYDHFRHAMYQAPVYPQPLSFGHWQNH